MLVVIHHFMQRFFSFAPTNAVGDFFSLYGYFGVDIFFVLSGFIMAYTLLLKEKSAIEFLKSRVVRIIPPYYFYTMLILLMGFIFNNIHSSSASFSTVLKSLMFVPHVNPDLNLGIYPTLTVGWTLNIEMFFYCLLATLLLFRGSLVGKLAVAVTLLFLLPVTFRILEFTVYKSVAGNMRLFEFAEGIVLGILFVRYSKFFHSTCLKLLATSLLLAVFINVPYIIKDILVSALIVYFVLVFRVVFSFENFINNILVYLGKISYSIYLSHSVVILLIWSFIPQLTSELIVCFTFVTVIALTLFMSHFSYKFIEVNVSYYLFKRISLSPVHESPFVSRQS